MRPDSVRPARDGANESVPPRPRTHSSSDRSRVDRPRRTVRLPRPSRVLPENQNLARILERIRSVRTLRVASLFGPRQVGVVSCSSVLTLLGSPKINVLLGAENGPSDYPRSFVDHSSSRIQPPV